MNSKKERFHVARAWPLLGGRGAKGRERKWGTVVDPSNLLILSKERNAPYKCKGCQAIFTRDISVWHFSWLRDSVFGNLQSSTPDRVTKSSGHLHAVGYVEIMKSSTLSEISLFDFPCHNKIDKASFRKRVQTLTVFESSSCLFCAKTLSTPVWSTYVTKPNPLKAKSKTAAY